ncbi:2-oxoacid:acceptor oxidoreductase subunit alpha [Streptomyces sp. NPDC051572]|uniref:2-oxoacid:acceptor oxidoreductase subunit alpha n=1 Tax=unclassified Streptomyces TaxID=2593676 RepID=UPI00344B3C63
MRPYDTPGRETADAEKLDHVVIRIAGDSGDGMQLAGDRFTAEAAVFGNDLATQPNFPAEIRAPQGTLPGVSSFQIQIADHDVLTAGDRPDVLVAMNPAALRANVDDLRPGGTLLLNTDEFTRRNLAKAGYAEDPLGSAEFEQYTIHEIPMTTLTVGAVEPAGLGKKDAVRAKNMFALGLLSWLYGRDLSSVETFLAEKFRSKPAVATANILALKAGWNYGETTETFAVSYDIAPAALPSGTYRQITGNTALAYGVLAAGELSGMDVFFGSYPITPASDILHELSRHKELGAVTFQAEDEIAAVGAAIGASWGGALGVTATSGPGLALKAEGIGLAVMTELPLVVICVQRGGPSTGLPTKTEQADLLQALFGRNGESPLPVIAPRSPGDCFAAAVEAARTAVTYRTPVLLLSDGALANGSEPWNIPDLAGLERIDPDLAVGGGADHRPYARDPLTLARDWAIPGTPGLEHRIGGLEKSDGAGDISYDPANHELMTRLRRAKVDGVRVPDLEVDDPDDDAEVLLLGWGSSYGPIGEAVRRLRETGHRVARAHLRHLNPLPVNTGAVLGSYRRVLVPEMNLGQLSMLLRARYLVDVQPVTKVAGTAFLADEVHQAVLDEFAGVLARRESDRTTDALAAAALR